MAHMTVEADVKESDHAVELVLGREQARHRDEAQRTRHDLPALLDLPVECLFAGLQQDLTTVSSAAIQALTEIRAAFRPGHGQTPHAEAVEAAAAVRRWLATAADSLRSAQARHLVLAVVPPGQGER